MSMSYPARHTHEFSVTDWQRMGEMNLFAPESRVELIEGQIFDMPPIGTEHSGCIDWLNQNWFMQLQGKALIRVQNPLRLGDFSEPQPDIMLLKPRADFYRKAHPQAEDVLLLIEVADSSVDYDKTIKIPLYARYGICETWIINIPEQLIHIYQQPENNSYKIKIDKQQNENLTAQAFPEIQFTVKQILGLLE